ncbi:hypothetical protein T09_14147 [Trichinella sp. T9]|nr:hypothetical protein T09_14147 [Trichinella sp. T9]
MTFFEIVCIGTPFPQLLLASAKGNWRYKYHKEIDKRKNKIKMVQKQMMMKFNLYPLKKKPTKMLYVKAYKVKR